MTNKGIQEKNNLSSSAAPLYFLKIDIPALDEILYITNNNENTTWVTQEYISLDIDIDDINSNSSGEIPEFNLKLSNIKNEVAKHIRTYETHIKNNGYDEDISVDINVVFSNNLDNPTPETNLKMILRKPHITPEVVTFTLGASNGSTVLILSRMLKNICRWNFKDIRCGYAGGAATCNATLSNCTLLNNGPRFGGTPYVGNEGIIL
jgi:phage-related protein